MADISFHGKFNSEIHFVLSLRSIHVMGQEKKTGLECKEACNKILQLAAAKLWMPKHYSKKLNSKISYFFQLLIKLINERGVVCLREENAHEVLYSWNVSWHYFHYLHINLSFKIQWFYILKCLGNKFFLKQFASDLR